MQRSNVLKAAALGVLMTVSASCVVDPHYHGAPPLPRPAYYYPDGYYYYPSVQVYFHYSTGFYFYPRGKVWIRSRVLPPKLHLDSRDRVHLELKSKKPYLYHQRQVKKYRPSKEHKPLPENNRKERESLKQWYKEQEQYKQEKRFKEKPRKKDRDKRQR